MKKVYNCGNKYRGALPDYFFKWQLGNKEILTECPNTYFNDLVKYLYHGYNSYKINGKLGIVTSPKDLSYFEVLCYNIIDNELNHAQNESMKGK